MVIKNVYIGNGNYISLKCIAIILLKNFSKGFKSHHATDFLYHYFFNQGILIKSYENPFKTGYFFKKMCDEGYLDRKLTKATIGKDGKIKRRYFYKINKTKVSKKWN